MSDMSNSEKNDNGSACERRAGVAIYIAAASMSIVLAAALGVGLMVAGRIKMLNEAGDSVKAFSLAQIGVEDALFKQIDSAGSSYSWTDGDSRYESDVICLRRVCLHSIHGQISERESGDQGSNVNFL